MLVSSNCSELFVRMFIWTLPFQVIFDPWDYDKTVENWAEIAWPPPANHGRGKCQKDERYCTIFPHVRGRGVWDGRGFAGDLSFCKGAGLSSPCGVAGIRFAQLCFGIVRVCFQGAFPYALSGYALCTLPTIVYRLYQQTSKVLGLMLSLDGQNGQSPIARGQRTRSTLASHSAVPCGTNVKRMNANRAIRIAAQCED